MSNQNKVTTYSFELPLGVLVDDEPVKNVEIREMTGNDRTKMANTQYRNKPGQLVTELLKDCTVSLGDNTSPSKKLFLDMTNGDRDFLLLMLRKVSLEEGDIIKSQEVCPGCDENIILELDVENDIPIKRFNAEEFEIDNNCYITTLENEKYNIKTRFKLVNGRIQEKTTKLMNVNPMAANYKMYEECLVDWNGQEVKNTQKFIKDLSVKILDWLEREYQEVQPGPDWRHKHPCPVCGFELLINLRNSDFLFPFQD